MTSLFDSLCTSRGTLSWKCLGTKDGTTLGKEKYFVLTILNPKYRNCTRIESLVFLGILKLLKETLSKNNCVSYTGNVTIYSEWEGAMGGIYFDSIRLISLEIQGWESNCHLRTAWDKCTLRHCWFTIQSTLFFWNWNFQVIDI